MIKIYGSPKSSSGRCFWCLEEIGQNYEAQPINFKEKEHKSEAYLEINPNGKVPALVDKDFKIWESMAINFYLAKAYKPEFLGSNAQSNGLIHQWSFWAIADLQPPFIDIFIQLVFVPENRRNHDIVTKANDKIPPLLKVIEHELENKDYIVGDRFSLADLNVASVVSICHEIKYDLSNYPKISQWLDLLSQRPAYKRYKELC